MYMHKHTQVNRQAGGETELTEKRRSPLTSQRKVEKLFEMTVVEVVQKFKQLRFNVCSLVWKIRLISSL